MDINIEPYIMRRITLEEEEESLQRLCESCSDYYEIVEGRAPQPDAAHEIITELPPDKDHKDKVVLGIYNQSSSLVGVMDLILDYPSKEIWMIGLLMIDPSERGKGLGKRVHEGLAKTASDLGAKTLRIGVAKDNHNAQHFWSALQYTTIKEVEMKLGVKDSTVYVMHYDLHNDTTI